MFSFQALQHLKDFLSDRPEWAFLAISLTVNAYLFRLLIKEKDARLSTALRVVPLAEKLIRLLQGAAHRRRAAMEQAREVQSVRSESPPAGTDQK